MFASCFSVFEPPPDEPALAWFRRYMQTADKVPYDHGRSPHVGAPGGPLEAMLDPLVREIVLQWASRTAKTLSTLSSLIYKSDVQPSPTFVVGPERTKVEEVVGERAAEMIDLCGRFPGSIKPRGRRPKRRIRLPRNEWRSGFARNPTTLADISAKFVHCFEVDKFAHPENSTEGDPLDLAIERAKEWPDAKIWIEGTPTVEGKSRVERYRLTGWNCFLLVPCPKCLRWQRLSMGKGGPGGIVFQKAAGDRLNADLARRTAHFVCGHGTCHAELGDEHRPFMMRRGVWVPEGCEIDHDGAAALFDGLPTPKDGELPPTHHDHPDRPYAWRGWDHATWVRGTPLRNNERASYQLSTIYSLQVGWGRVAKEFVESTNNPTKLQNFVNSWLGETWKVRKREETWETIAKKLAGTTDQGTVPAGFSTLVCGVDHQIDHYVYLVLAVGKPWQFAIVDYGTRDTYDEIEQEVLLIPYPHADGGRPVHISRAFVDTGFTPVEEDGDEVYKLCRRTTQRASAKQINCRVKPCKGASKQLKSIWERSVLGSNTNSPGSELYFVCSFHTQPIVEAMLFKNGPDEEGGLQLFNVDDPAEHQDLIEQLLNDQEQLKIGKNNNPTLTWDRINDTIPNDLRDSLRYAYAALHTQFKRGRVPARMKEAPPPPAARSEPRESGFRTPDGRNFFVNER